MEEPPAVPPSEPPPPYDWSPPTEPPAAPPPRAVIPWEDRTRPWTGALVETVRLLLTSPRQAFERVPVSGDVLRPVLFGLLLGWVGLCFAALWQLTLGDSMRALMPAAAGPDDSQRIFYLAMIPLGPLYVACVMLLVSAVLHVILLLVGGARNGFAATLRAVSYAQVANLGLVLPFCGGLLASLGVLVLEVIGLSALHRISVGKAILAVVIPVAFCCACALIGLVLFGASLMGGGFRELMQ